MLSANWPKYQVIKKHFQNANSKICTCGNPNHQITYELLGVLRQVLWF